jgi:uncharacterized protein (TIGR03086 family)
MSTALAPAALLAPAAAPIVEIVRGLDGSRLGAPTPCAGYDVRALLHHLLFWGPVLASAARKVPTAPAAAAESDVNLVTGNWPAALDALFADLVDAWSGPASWEGTTSMGGPTELPAPMVGGMAMGELVVHGWDLGRALGRAPTWDEPVLEFVHHELLGTAEMGRQMGVFGPEVPVPATAPTLDRLLGIAGRDPRWVP